MRKMRKPSSEQYQLDKETDKKLRKEVSRIYEDQNEDEEDPEDEDYEEEYDEDEAEDAETTKMVPAVGRPKTGVAAKSQTAKLPKVSENQKPASKTKPSQDQSGAKSGKGGSGNGGNGGSGKGGKKKKKVRAADIIYKVLVVVMILVCCAGVAGCVRLIVKSQNKEITYVYYQDGTTGYEAPSGVTIEEGETGGDGTEVLETTTKDDDITIIGTIIVEETESESETETETETEEEVQMSTEEQTYSVLDTDNLEQNLIVNENDE